MKEIFINTPFIKLDSFLKLAGDAMTGAMAKEGIKEGKIKVNGEICTMRGKKLYDGDRVEGIYGSYLVSKSEDN